MQFHATKFGHPLVGRQTIYAATRDAGEARRRLRAYGFCDGLGYGFGVRSWLRRGFLGRRLVGVEHLHDFGGRTTGLRVEQTPIGVADHAGLRVHPGLELHALSDGIRVRVLAVDGVVVLGRRIPLLLGLQGLQGIGHAGLHLCCHLLVDELLNACGHSLFGEVPEQVHVGARRHGRLSLGGQGVGIGRGLSGRCPRLCLRLQGGQLLLDGSCCGNGFVALSTDLLHLIKTDGVLAIPCQDHGVRRVLLVFGKGFR